MHVQDPVVVIGAKRTPMGNFNGIFKDAPSPRLGGHVIAAALAEIPLSHPDIDELIMGCVLPAGLGQAPARQAALAAQLPQSTPCTTLNKMCGSGMKALMVARHEIQSGNAKLIVAGGMENMSRAPYLLPGARFGYRLGAHATEDHLMLDGLLNAYGDHESMGKLAENCVKQFNITRAQQDAFAITSCERAFDAAKLGFFKTEIAPILIQDKTISEDEGISKINLDKIVQLKPTFAKDGTITAANASSISDGAAALVFTRLSIAKEMNIKPLATFIGDATFAQAPEWFSTAPVGAIQRLCEKIQWTIDEVDLFEINEAFAVVTLYAMQALRIPHEKVNVHGGACILGHPIGASGARIVVTLINALRQRHKKRGIAALCIGGGEATAIAIECNYYDNH